MGFMVVEIPIRYGFVLSRQSIAEMLGKCNGVVSKCGRKRANKKETPTPIVFVLRVSCVHPNRKAAGILEETLTDTGEVTYQFHLPLLMPYLANTITAGQRARLSRFIASLF
jgi:hypothetical protein